MRKILGFLLSFWPTLLVIGVILYATLASDPVGEELPPIPYLDKLIHAIMMGGLVGAIAFDLQRRCDKKNPEKARGYLSQSLMLWIVCGVLLFSVADEWLQGLMENGRSSDPIDFIADSVGTIVAFFTAPPAIRKVLKVK